MHQKLLLHPNHPNVLSMEPALLEAVWAGGERRGRDFSRKLRGQSQGLERRKPVWRRGVMGASRKTRELRALESRKNLGEPEVGVTSPCR